MTQNVAVISPTRQQGITTVSAMIALAMSITQNQRTCLTFTGSDITSINTFFGLKPIDDKTRTTSLLVKLLEANTLSGEEIGDVYCSSLYGVPNLHILDSASGSITEEENDKLVEFAVKQLPHEVIITDVSSEIYAGITRSVIENANLVVMVLSQSTDCLSKIKLWEQAKWDPEDPNSPTIMEKLVEKGLIFAFNQFDANVQAFRDTTKSLGLRHRRCCKLSYNPFIKRMSNEGKLHTLLPYIIRKDPRVVNLNLDIKELMMVITSNLGIRMQWKESI